MSKIIFGIIGGGWRSLFYLRIARELPERFEVAGLLVRDPEKGKELEKNWHVPTFRSLDELLKCPGLAFVVVSVAWPATPAYLKELAQRGIPVLSETPPAPDLEGLQSLQPLIEQRAKIQVAEQYQFQPLHAARLALARSGKLGEVTQAQLSVAHGYHGVNLIRNFLNIQFECATISAYQFTSPLLENSSSEDQVGKPHSKPSRQVIATLDFGDRLGVYDFTGDQYFSWIRSPRVLIRGEAGEINNTTIRYLEDASTPVTLEFQRLNAGENGNLEGYYLKGIQVGNEWIYRNPFIPGRLSDDEIAIATCLEKMAEYVDSSTDTEGFYGLAQAAQDHYINLMIEQALKTNLPVHMELQTWASG